jgi:large subunit ribosomal protein L21
MYAIVSTGGKQYKVAKGDVIDVEKLDAQPGDKVKLDVLMLNDGKKVVVDAAALEKMKVTAKVVEQFRGEKQLVFKLEKRKRYHRCNGHRQSLTKLEVTTMPSAKAPAKKASTEKSEAADTKASE